jgi:hypothetical protein
MNAALCWICGAPANSAEHMVKASDFRSHFGRVTQQAPVYRHSRERRNEPVRGADAQPLKFRPSLCSNCNNARTQSHDKAWEKLSSAIRRAQPPPASGAVIPLHQIFGGGVKQAMLDVHLYFTKLLGCYAVEHAVPLPINHFALCVRNGVPHPHVYLSFVQVASNAGKNDIIVGNISTMNIGGRTVSATWFYVIGILGVHVAYIEPGRPRMYSHRGWHPHDIGSVVRMQPR